MKRLILTLILATSASLAHAALDQDALCENVADFSGLVATQRDAGTPLVEMKRQIQQTPIRSDVRALFLKVAGAVYMGPQYANLSPNQTRSFTFQNCMAMDLH